MPNEMVASKFARFLIPLVETLPLGIWTIPLKRFPSFSKLTNIIFLQVFILAQRYTTYYISIKSPRGKLWDTTMRLVFGWAELPDLQLCSLSLESSSICIHPTIHPMLPPMNCLKFYRCEHFRRVLLECVKDIVTITLGLRKGYGELGDDAWACWLPIHSGEITTVSVRMVDATDLRCVFFFGQDRFSQL